MLDSRAAWVRLSLLLLVSSIGGVGMWSVVVTLPAVQIEFGVARAGAALPYTLTMLGFAVGGVVMGRASDRFGIARVVAVAGLMLAAGYALASRTYDLLSYALVHGVLIGMLGSGALFGPVMAEASLWFRRRRGVAVGIAPAGKLGILNKIVIDPTAEEQLLRPCIFQANDETTGGALTTPPTWQDHSSAQNPTFPFGGFPRIFCSFWPTVVDYLDHFEETHRRVKPILTVRPCAVAVV